jgi:hypothetical protein
MSLLESATVEQLRRLLEFFPASTLKGEWPGLKGQKKDAVCELIAATKDVARIKSFVTQYFAHCRQHVLILQKPELQPATLVATAEPPDLTTVFPPSESIGTMSGGIEFRLSSIPYKVYLLNPMEEISIEVLWPIRIEERDELTIIRTVVLERDPANYSGRQSIKATREVDEKKIALDLADLGFHPLDINKGVKALWGSKSLLKLLLICASLLWVCRGDVLILC